MRLNFVCENIAAINFVNLNKARALEVLEARNAVREFMQTRREISEVEHFRFIESLRNNKNSAYFAVYEVDSNESALQKTQGATDSVIARFGNAK